MAKGICAAVLVPYWDFWAKCTSVENFREDRIAIGNEVEKILVSAEMEVGFLEMVDSEACGSRVGSEMGHLDIDVIVVVQSLCAPPTYLLAAIEKLGRVPVVVWAVQRTNLLDRDFDVSHITETGAAVGTPMLTSTLCRIGRPYELSAGLLSDPNHVQNFTRTVKAAAIAAQLGRARIGRVGRPIEGYICVDASADAIRDAVGAELVDIEVEELCRRYREADQHKVHELERWVNSEFHIPSGDTRCLSESLRLTEALRKLDSDFNLDAGVMNCHVPELRYSEDPGITPCFALGTETSAGIPWVCSGDVLTAIAMVAAKKISGAALYHEIEGFDVNSGELGIANSGEHDLCWCRKGNRPRFQKNPWYLQDAKTGYSLKFDLAPGPATLIGFTASREEPSGFRFIAAQGLVSDRSFPNSPSAAGSFAFLDTDLIVGWSQWVKAGVNHHCALARGHVAWELTIIAKFLQIGCVQIC